MKKSRRWRVVVAALAAALTLGVMLSGPAAANNDNDVVTHSNNDEGAIWVRTNKPQGPDYVTVYFHEHDWFNLVGWHSEGHLYFSAADSSNDRIEIYWMELQEKVGNGNWIVLEHNNFTGTLWSPGDTVDTDRQDWGDCEPSNQNGVYYRTKVDYHIWWGPNQGWAPDEKTYASDAAYGQNPC